MDNHDNHGIYDVFIKFMKSAWKKKKSGVGEYALMHVGNVVSGYGDVFRA